MLFNTQKYQKSLTTLVRKYRTIDPTITSLGLKVKDIVRNPTVSELYEYALDPYHKPHFNEHVRDSAISSTGALVSYSGKRTGRVPKEKRVVCDSETKNKIWWSDANIPLSQESYDINRKRVIDYLNTR